MSSVRMPRRLAPCGCLPALQWCFSVPFYGKAPSAGFGPAEKTRKVQSTLSITLGTFWRLLPLVVIIGVGLLLIFMLGQRFGILGQRRTLPVGSLANPGSGDAREVSIFSLLPKDGIRSIDEPTFLSADEAEAQMASGELVLGLELDGEARAYPINILSRHEIVNDVVAGVPVAITYCPLCFTGIVYDRRVDGRVLEFGVSGKLIMNDLVMYDRQTDSLWQQILGEGIKGRFKGVKLTPIAATHTTWAQWRTIHPETLVLDKSGAYGSDNYSSYYARSDSGVLGGSLSDDRLPAKELVLGVVIQRQTKAYPFTSLFTDPVINDSLGGSALLIVFDPRSTTAVAFDRGLEGRTLTFVQVASETGEPLVEDTETGSVWSGLTGRAISGPLEGTELRQIAATYSFWFAWSDFYTQTEIYELD